MNIFIQIISLIISFLYGVFIYYFNVFNKKVINNKKLIYDIIFRIIYVYLLVLLYIVIMFKINKGIFHNYFLLLMLLGYFISYRKCKIRM